jgi:predicted Zn finger-like uncharacterized protein
MIVTCPACSVRYLVDARALGLKGRTVRCARCGHTWHQDAPEDAVAQEPIPQASDVPEAAAAPRRDEPPPRHVDAVPELAGERRIQLPALSRPRRRWGPALAWILALVVLLAGLGYAALRERDRIVAVVPGAAAIYARVGFPPEASGTGLEFRNVATSREMENGLPALVVSGEVTNVSSVPRDVPKLVVILRDSGEHDLQNTSISVNQARLAPGETIPFHASIAQPAEAASGVVVTFAGANPG